MISPKLIPDDFCSVKLDKQTYDQNCYASLLNLDPEYYRKIIFLPKKPKSTESYKNYLFLEFNKFHLKIVFGQ